MLTQVLFQGASSSQHTPQGLIVEFPALPQIGQIVEIDGESIKFLNDESLHVGEWRVVDVRYSISGYAPGVDSEGHPEALLQVSIIPTSHPWNA